MLSIIYIYIKIGIQIILAIQEENNNLNIQNTKFTSVCYILQWFRFYKLTLILDFLLQVKLNEIAKQIDTKDLRFGDENIMQDILDVSKGSVTAYSVINDKKNKVTLLLDSKALDSSN